MPAYIRRISIGKKFLRLLLHIGEAAVIVLLANSCTMSATREHPLFLILLIPGFLWINVAPSGMNARLLKRGRFHTGSAVPRDADGVRQYLAAAEIHPPYDAAGSGRDRSQRGSGTQTHPSCDAAGSGRDRCQRGSGAQTHPSYDAAGQRTGKRLCTCANGCVLLRLFLLSTVVSITWSLAGWLGYLPCGPFTQMPGRWIANTLVAVLTEAVVFWNGIIRIYLTSEQLGIRWRVLGIVCGWIPVAHLIVLGILIRTAETDVATEHEKLLLNEKRSGERICATRYPLLLVHGVFFRDSRYVNYWGRIPKELEKNGAVIYYGNHQSAAPVSGSAQELDRRIRQIVAETGCEKVNIIAHSKGGLDSRFALAKLGTDSMVASLTTINTPHRGCEFADYLLGKIPKKQQEMVAATYNATLKKLGDTNPDFLAAVRDLTAEVCRRFNEEVQDAPGVWYQSTGSKLTTAAGGRFPLNFTCRLVHYFDGMNDGLVGEKSFPWGERYQFLEARGKRGISHGDMIDMNRENFDGFDVREFYVQLVSDLKKRGF